MKNYKGITALLLGCILFISCSRKVGTLVTADQLIVYPPPPDTTRIQFLTSITSSLDITKKQSKIQKMVFGEDRASPIGKPYGISLGNGKLFVCDMDIEGLEIIDLLNNKFEYFVPSGLGKLTTPINCFYDPIDSLLYVADAQRRQVVVFNDDREYVNSFGDTDNFKPIDVLVTNNEIWVTNSKNNGIYVYDKDSYKFLRTFPDIEKGKDGHLYMPLNMDIASDKIYVGDFGDFKIKTYTLDGQYIESIGSYGRNIGQFARPKGVAVDRNENLYVVDGAFENVQVFNKEKQLLMFFGGTYNGPGGMWLPAQVLVDYDHNQYFEQYVYKDYQLEYLILVSNQYGPDKINVYGYVTQRDKD